MESDGRDTVLLCDEGSDGVDGDRLQAAVIMAMVTSIVQTEKLIAFWMLRRS